MEGASAENNIVFHFCFVILLLGPLEFSCFFLTIITTHTSLH